jgi:hypothetical protein
MDVYYAHMRCLYGTKEEGLQKSMIASRFPGCKIVDPSLLQGSITMDFFINLVKSCDALVFSRIDGEIGAGVGKEANTMIGEGKPVYELLPDGSTKLITEPLTYLNIPDTLALLKRHEFTVSEEEKKRIDQLDPKERLATK